VLPVNFKAAEEGTYTLAIALEEVELQYLTLVDKLNNMEVDLLSTPAYTFTATPSDMVNRFTLRFKANTNVSENETVNPIAYRHDGLLNISGIEGESELQIIDMLGRVISSAIINGNYTTMIDNTPGTYVVRLINGKDTYTQKIVVE